MKKSIITFLAAVLSWMTFPHTILYAQTEVDENILRQLNDYCLKVPWEDIFVHTDRDYYVSGEDMWFNFYATDRQSGTLSALSRIAYCELLNPYNIPVIRKRVILESGKGSGYISLPDTLRSGEYTLIVYTNWMKNFLPGNCFIQNITIFNPFRSSSFMKKIISGNLSSRDINVEFFPEGGTLIADVTSKVVVMVNDRFGQGMEFTGIIRNNSDDSVTFFKTDKSGFGSFKFIPEKGVSYKVSSPGLTAFLPDVSESGYSILADNSDRDVVSITVSLKENNLKNIDKRLLIFIHTRGIKNYSEFFTITGENARLAIPKSTLLPGINHITLFSDEGRALCERLIFTRGSELSEPAIHVKGNFKRREKADTEIDISDMPIMEPSGAELSISVVPVNSVFNSRDIEDYFVFGTEFGFLPACLIKQKIRDIDDDCIDNFLITAESNWLSWDKILGGNNSGMEYLPESDGHYISGFVRKRDSEEIVPEKLLYLSMPGKTATFQYCITDSSGHFRFLLPADYSSKDLIIQPAMPDEKITIQIENSFASLILPQVIYTDTINRVIPKFASDFSVGYQIDKIYNIIHHTESVNENHPIIPKGRFYGIPETELIMDDFIRLPVMQEIFFELTPGIKLRSKKSVYEMRVNNPVDNVVYDNPPLVLIDGVVINDLSILANLDPEKVERIDAVRTPYLTGGLIHYGIINVITEKGNFENINLPDYVARLTYRVADPIPRFSYPDSDIGNKRKPDFRNTLYWNGFLTPDAQGKVYAEFRTSDRPGDYLINIQGITNKGKVISVRKVIAVE